MPPSEPLAQLLAGTYPDPETGALLGTEVRAVAIEPTLAGAEAELLKRLGLGPRLAVISDEDTHEALGSRVVRALRGQFAVTATTLGRRPQASAATLARLIEQVDVRADAIVAVGAGTINDLCKLLARARSVPQVVFATAPSMNGYTSLSASLLEAGLKRSVRAATPVGVFFDLEVLAAAPPRLLRAGLGDSACRPTAQADWLLAHLVLGRPYREAPFALLATEEPALLADPAGLLRGDREALRALVRTLVLSGIGMTLCDGSYPASQGEHLISHYVEAMGPPEVLDALHGEQIAVATVAMARLQDRVLERSAPPRLRASTVTRESVLSHFGGERGEVCWRELAPKLLDEERAAALTAHLAQGWDAIRSRIREVTLGADRHDQILAAAGAPRTPADLRWPEPLWQAALRYARLQRNRYTFMDLDADMGAYGA